jgi:hypothetical protein
MPLAKSPSKSLALDHLGPAWSEPTGESKRRTPARTRPVTKAASPSKPAAATPAARSKSAAKAAEREASAEEPARKSPKASPKASPTASPKASPVKVAKAMPVSVAKTAKKQLADDGLGDYWTATPQSRRKTAPARAVSPVVARPGTTPPKAFMAGELDADDDEPIATVGGGWLINKVILSCLICTLASLVEQAALRRAPVQLAAVGAFAGWGALSGAISTLWAKLLGWATESMRVGPARTTLTVLVDQLVMGARAKRNAPCVHGAARPCRGSMLAT